MIFCSCLFKGSQIQISSSERSLLGLFLARIQMIDPDVIVVSIYTLNVHSYYILKSGKVHSEKVEYLLVSIENTSSCFQQRGLFSDTQTIRQYVI